MSRDRAEVITSPPLLYLPTIFAGVVLHFRWRPLWVLPTWWLGLIVGVPLVVVGLAFSEWAERRMRSFGGDPKPSVRTVSLVTTCPYAFSRNPMYLFMAIAYVGVSIALNSWWPILLMPVLILLIDRGAIAREERHVEEATGEPFREYRSLVRRWL